MILSQRLNDTRDFFMMIPSRTKNTQENIRYVNS